MRDGLYQVQWRGVTAGFVVAGGWVVRRAPVLRRWGVGGLMAKAVWLGP